MVSFSGDEVRSRGAFYEVQARKSSFPNADFRGAILILWPGEFGLGLALII